MKQRISLFFLALLCFGSAFFLLAYGATEWMMPDLRIYLLTASALVLLWLPVWLEFAEEKHDPLAPIPLQAAGYSALFVLSGAYLMLKPDLNPYGYTEYFDDAMAVMLLGWFATVVGNRLTVGHRLGSSFPKIEWPSVSPIGQFQVALILLAIGWAAQLVQIVTGVYFHTFGSAFRWSPSNSVVEQIRLLRYIGLMILAFQAWQPKLRMRRSKFLLLIIVLLEGAFSLGSGKRIDVITMMFILAAVYIYSGRLRLTHRSVIGFVVAGLLVVVLLGFLDEYRNQLFTFSLRSFGRVGVMDIWHIMGLVLDRSLSYEGLQRLIDLALVRLADIASLAALLSPAATTDTPRLGATFLPSLFNTLLIAVPRNVLPVKPDVNAPYRPFMSHYFPYFGGSRPITYIGEAYYNFGLVGVVFIMLFYGIFQKAFYEYCSPDEGHNLALRAAYILVAIHFMWVSSNLAPLIPHVARVILYVLVVRWFITVHRRIAAHSRDATSQPSNQKGRPASRISWE